MPTVTKTSKQMVDEAKARIEEIETGDALAMVNNPDVVMVDIRDIRERQSCGFIPGSFHCPRGLLEFWVDSESPYFNEIFAQDKKFVIYCAAGWRSALSTATLKDMGFTASHLKDGFADWEKMNGPIAFPEKQGK